MTAAIHSERDLEQANLRLAWQFTRNMTDQQVDRLCEVTARFLREEQAIRAQQEGAA